MTHQPQISHRPGANVHPIQARLGLTAMGRRRPVRIAAVGATTVDLTLDGISFSHRCDHALRLRELVASGRSLPSADGQGALLVPESSLLIVPHADTDGPPPARLPVDATVAAFDPALGATSSPSDGGTWALLSVARLYDREKGLR